MIKLRIRRKTIEPTPGAKRRYETKTRWIISRVTPNGGRLVGAQPTFEQALHAATLWQQRTAMLDLLTRCAAEPGTYLCLEAPWIVGDTPDHKRMALESMARHQALDIDIHHEWDDSDSTIDDYYVSVTGGTNIYHD
jgi:hypothetical protein